MPFRSPKCSPSEPSTQPAETVLSQSPVAGALAAHGSTVTVSVSKGPKTSQIPDVTAEGRDVAVSTLKASGFTVHIRSADTTDPAIAQSIFATMKELGKAPIWVKKDVPGFVGNRIQHAMLREALYLIQDGICDPEGVDTAVRFGFGFRFIACGPILQKEMSGWDTSFLVASALYPHLYKNDGPPPVSHNWVTSL